jgi:excisionase family DNA binding protein
MPQHMSVVKERIVPKPITQKLKRLEPLLPSVPVTRETQDQEYLTVAGAAEFVHCSRDNIRHLLTRGELTRFKFGGRTLIKRSELLSLIRVGK